MTPFRWKNCFADVQASKHDITIQSYFDDVILPALATLDRRIDELGREGVRNLVRSWATPTPDPPITSAPYITEITANLAWADGPLTSRIISIPLYLKHRIDYCASCRGR